MIKRTWAGKDGKIRQETIKPEIFYQLQTQCKDSLTDDEIKKNEESEKMARKYMTQAIENMASDVLNFGRPLNVIKEGYRCMGINRLKVEGIISDDVI